MGDAPEQSKPNMPKSEISAVTNPNLQPVAPFAGSDMLGEGQRQSTAQAMLAQPLNYTQPGIVQSKRV